MAFLDELEKDTNFARTENGAASNASSLDYVLDFFSKAAAMRGRHDEALNLFKKAYAQDRQLAVRALFWLRDVRGGQGERDLFRHIYESLDNNVKASISRYIEEYGRWDDVARNTVNIEVIKSQLREDLENLEKGNNISLLAKWLPSVNASSKKSREEGLKLARALDMSERNYRKMLSRLRAKMNLLETQMSSREWLNIDYSKVPSQALRRHTKAFKRHDEDRFTEFLEKATKGEVKINTSTLYAYEVYNMVHRGEEAAANAMWKNLPDYTRGENAIVMADVSGSMQSSYGSITPMSISVSLALYFADKNKGPFKDYFMTFSENSKLQKVVGQTLSEKMNCIQRADWGMSTNLQSAFDSILNAAQKANATQDELPQTLYIISDMQFNQAESGSYYYSSRKSEKTNFQAAKDKFEAAGYKLPHVVFWNVNARDDSPATKYDENVTLISGSSQSTFQFAMQGKTPIESMLEVLNSPRYEQIVL